MNMEYWKSDTGEVFGFDVSDEEQVAAKTKCLAQGVWQDVTGNWPPPPPPATKAQNKAQALSLLQLTDWVNQPDVYDSASTPHLLNRQEFLTYRAWVRGIAITPVEGDLTWPTQPTAVWSV